MENDNAVIVLGIFLGVCLAALLIVKIAIFLREFNDVVGYLTGEMRRAGDDDEYRYWRRELRCHYLCLIPFVNEKNVMQVYKKVFYKPKHNTPVKRSDGIFLVLAPSVIGIAVCALCLCGTSWAWFTSTTSAGTNTIKSATFQISDVQIEKGSAVTEVSIGDDGKYTSTLDVNKTYTLSFEADDANTSSKGYCCITVYKGTETAGTNYYTDNIGDEDPYTIKVVNYESTSITVKIQPFWGDVPNNLNDEAKISSGGTITVGTAGNSGSNGVSNSNALTKQNTSETTEQTTTPAQEVPDTATEDKAATATPETTAAETEKQEKTAAVTTEEPTDTEPANGTTETDKEADATETPGTGETDGTDQ